MGKLLYFSSYEEFKIAIATDNEINGTSNPRHPKLGEYSSNEGCWNCEDCYDCNHCISCNRCIDCNGCITCKNCRDCNGCIDCNKCTSCKHCKSCTRCNSAIDAIDFKYKNHETYCDSE